MARVIRAFRIYDDANSEVRMYRPGMTISGPDAAHKDAQGNIAADDADGEVRAKPAPANKARTSAPENK
jgi:hypothetical protein